jgi:hypothetical protein
MQQLAHMQARDIHLQQLWPATAQRCRARTRRHCTVCPPAGSSTQIGVLVVPFCVVLAWMMGQPLDLNFKEFEALVLFISVLLAAVVVQVGRWAGPPVCRGGWVVASRVGMLHTSMHAGRGGCARGWPLPDCCLTAVLACPCLLAT